MEQPAGQQPEPTVVDPGTTEPPADTAHQGEVTPPASEVSAPTEVSTDVIPQHILEENAAAKEMLKRLNDPEVARAMANSLAREQGGGDQVYAAPPTAVPQPLAQPAPAEAEPTAQMFMPAGTPYDEGDAFVNATSPSAVARAKAADEKVMWLVRQETDKRMTEFTRAQQEKQNQAWQRTQVEKGVSTLRQKYKLSDAETTKYEGYLAKILQGLVPIDKIIEGHFLGENLDRVIEQRAQERAAEIIAGGGAAPGGTIPSTVTSPSVGGSAEPPVSPGDRSITERIETA